MTARQARHRGAGRWEPDQEGRYTGSPGQLPTSSSARGARLAEHGSPGTISGRLIGQLLVAQACLRCLTRGEVAAVRGCPWVRAVLPRTRSLWRMCGAARTVIAETAIADIAYEKVIRSFQLARRPARICLGRLGGSVAQPQTHDYGIHRGAGGIRRRNCRRTVTRVLPEYLDGTLGLGQPAPSDPTSGDASQAISVGGRWLRGLGEDPGSGCGRGSQPCRSGP
jgi:hypothetical protein